MAFKEPDFKKCEEKMTVSPDGSMCCQSQAEVVGLYEVTSVDSFMPMRCGLHSFCMMQDASSQFLTIFCSAVLQSHTTP